MKVLASNAFHFVGVAGSGMMPLAILGAADGRTISGSDRAFDRNPEDVRIAALKRGGVAILPQDGSNGDATVVFSSAIEKSNPDLASARTTIHRSELLHDLMAGRKSILVGGSSGKTTTAAMIGWILEKTGRDPMVYLGGSVRGLAPHGARAGQGWVVAEVDESDGSIARFHPDIAVVTSVTEDHKPLAEIEALLRDFMAKGRVVCISEQAAYLGGTLVKTGPARTSLLGAFNRSNEALAIEAATASGVDRGEAIAALSDFPGVSRRLEIICRRDDRIVIDDFAHNPEKIAASLDAVAVLGLPVLVLFQPHGYGPAKFHREAYGRVFAHHHVILLPIYDAGGTAERTIRSEDILPTVMDRPDAKKAALAFLKSPGIVIVMGARDNTLSDYAREIAGMMP